MASSAACGAPAFKESEVLDSWEDIDIAQLEDFSSTCASDDTSLASSSSENPAGILPNPSEVSHGKSICAGRGWQVAYTWHAGRFESPCVRDDFAELFVAPDGGQVKAALLTTFHPFEPKFLQRLPHDADIVICVQDKFDDEPKKAPRHFFGIELQHVHQMNKQAEQCVYQATSTFCSQCLAADAPRRCSPGRYLRSCGCPETNHRRVQWVLPQFKGRDIMHSKVMLLRFHGFMRLVVSSFNLSERQWGQAGDSFWWADLPFCSAQHAPDRRMQLPLLDMLERLQVPHVWLQLLSYCDWTSMQEQHSSVHLVTSCPGGSTESSAHLKYGMDRLSQVLNQMPKFPPSKQCPADVQIWSLGGVGDRWYTDFALTLVQERISNLGLIAQWKHDHVRFIFQKAGGGPHWRNYFERKVAAENRVRWLRGEEEVEPKRSALKKVLWDESRSCLLDKKRAAEPVPWGWHSKVMTREYPQVCCKRDGCNRTHGWRYIGSHNCSKASWGWSSSESPRNFEAGVLLVSLPSKSAAGECGVDLRDAAPLPFRNIAHSYPAWD